MSEHLPQCAERRAEWRWSEDCICEPIRAALAAQATAHEAALAEAERRGFEGTPDIDDRLAAVYEQGVSDERLRIRTGVEALPWVVAVSFGPIDCNTSCEEGPCSCSGEMRPEAWTTGPAEVLAVIDGK